MNAKIETLAPSVFNVPAVFEAAAQSLARASVHVGPGDAGKTIDVPRGEAVAITLPALPSAGFRWFVAQTNRTFGSPVSDEIVGNPGGPVGGRTMQQLTWDTGGFLDKTGKHQVVLEYRRGENGEAAQSFVVTINVVA